jgi:O-antigen ligase
MRKIAFWLSLAFIFAIPCENVLMFDNGNTISRLIGLAAAGFWLLTILLTDRVRVPLPYHLMVFLFILWNAASIFWSADQNRTFERIQTYSQLAVLVFMLWDIYHSRPMLQSAFQAYVLGAYVTASGTLLSYLSASAYYYNRYAASGFNPNDAGLILALGIPLAWHLATHNGEAKLPTLLKIINFLYLPAAVFAIFLTGSRGPLAASVVSILFIISTLGQLRFRYQLLLITGLGVAVAVLLVVIPQTSFDRIANKGVALNGREDVWSEAFDLFGEHPILGVGSGSVKKVIEVQQSAHNFALGIVTETGLIGLGLFCCILLLVVRHAWRQEPRYRYLCLTLFAVWFIGASVHNWEHRKQTWLFFSLIVISSSVAATSVSATFDHRSFVAAREPEMEVA